MTSSGEKPTDPNRDKMESTLSNGSGTRFGGEAAFGCGRPRANLTRGAPGQLARLRAPASWMLQNIERSGVDKISRLLQIAWTKDMGVLLEEWTDGVKDVVETVVGGECQLSLVESENRSVSASSSDHCWYD